jgi:hypothetical protein
MLWDSPTAPSKEERELSGSAKEEYNNKLTDLGI